MKALEHREDKNVSVSVIVSVIVSVSIVSVVGVVVVGVVVVVVVVVVVGWCLLVVGCWSLGCRLNAVCCLLVFGVCLLFAVCWLLVVVGWLLVVGSWLLVVVVVLAVVGCWHIELDCCLHQRSAKLLNKVRTLDYLRGVTGLRS